MASPRSPHVYYGSSEQRRNEEVTSDLDLASLVESLRLEGNGIDNHTMDRVADYLRTKLNMDETNDRVFHSMAEAFLKCKIDEAGKQGSSTTANERSPLAEHRETWSETSSSSREHQPETIDFSSSNSPTEAFHRPSVSAARGRSPGGSGLPRPRFFGRRHASPTPETKKERKETRSRSNPRSKSKSRSRSNTRSRSNPRLMRSPSPLSKLFSRRNSSKNVHEDSLPTSYSADFSPRLPNGYAQTDENILRSRTQDDLDSRLGPIDMDDFISGDPEETMQVEPNLECSKSRLHKMETVAGDRSTKKSPRRERIHDADNSTPVSSKTRAHASTWSRSRTPPIPRPSATPDSSRNETPIVGSGEFASPYSAGTSPSRRSRFPNKASGRSPKTAKGQKESEYLRPLSMPPRAPLEPSTSMNTTPTSRQPAPPLYVPPAGAPPTEQPASTPPASESRSDEGHKTGFGKLRKRHNDGFGNPAKHSHPEGSFVPPEVETSVQFSVNLTSDRGSKSKGRGKRNSRPAYQPSPRAHSNAMPQVVPNPPPPPAAVPVEPQFTVPPPPMHYSNPPEMRGYTQNPVPNPPVPPNDVNGSYSPAKAAQPGSAFPNVQQPHQHQPVYSNPLGTTHPGVAAASLAFSLSSGASIPHTRAEAKVNDMPDVQESPTDETDNTVYPGGHGSPETPLPMEFEPTSAQKTNHTMANDIQFSIGIGEVRTKGAGARRRVKINNAQRGRSALQPSWLNDDLRGAASQDSTESYNYAQEHAEVGSLIHRDFSGAKAHATALREEARTFYLNGDYRSSITTYNKAIVSLSRDVSSGSTDDMLAILFSNRAAALLMLGMYELAAADCRRGLEFSSDYVPTDLAAAAENGPVLKAKLYLRLGRALVKMGDSVAADASFDKCIATVKTTSTNLGLSEQVRKSLFDYETKSALGKAEASRLKQATAKAFQSTGQAPLSGRSSERQNLVAALGDVNMALSTATGSVALNERKVALLASLKRWREVAGHCERLAAAAVKYDSIFTGDLESKNPFPGVAPAKVLEPDFFQDSKEDDIRTQELKLPTKAAAEAVLRLPASLMPYYLRALRLEERYPAAESALSALEAFAAKHNLHSSFSWLSMEREKLTHTKSGRDIGDELFRSGQFEMAASSYAKCLTVDGEGIAKNPDGTSAGGRLHAVLHCNRAACLMALKRFSEAVTECTAAIRIHSRYMKAMLRRARCYSRLERYEEAIAEYKRWLELVEEAKKSPLAAGAYSTPCLFDGPLETSKEDVDQVKQELAEVTRTKEQAETAARAEETYRQERERFHNEAFNRSYARGDARSRREEWYNQSGGPRRWDSFNDGGSKKPSRTQQQHDYHRSNSTGSSWNQNNGGRGTATASSENHYSVLQIEQHATEANIKKAYRKMALKYHPDKNKDPEAVEIFRRVKVAYEVLKDPAARRKYDAEIRWNRRF